MRKPRAMDRRTVLKATGGLLSVAGLTGTAAAKGGQDKSYGNGNGIGSFLNENPLFKEMPIWDSGVADMTGQSEVVIDVGAMTSVDIPEEDLPPEVEESPEEGPFGFAPQAVKISPETTVIWEWTGNPFAFLPGVPWPHDVHSLDGLFHSLHQGTGTFEHEFEETGTYLYYCTPHGNPGPDHPNLFSMRGAILVEGE